MGDPERYRTKAEVKKYVENGPIDRFRKFLMEKNSISEKTLNEIDKEAEKEIQEAVEFAENSPEPADEDLFKNIYVEE
jgi:pyruvate dehydrogenase E1 component alpha subunit